MLTKQAFKSTHLTNLINRNFGAVHKASNTHTFVAPIADKKMMVFDGLKAT
jgi:hypothetical protein